MFDLGQLRIKEKKASNIFDSLEEEILQGRLKPGDQLPPVRVLAETLGVNKNTAAVAYRLLQECGLIIADGRRGSVIAGARQPELSRAHNRMSTDAIQLQNGNPDPRLLPDEADVRKILSSVNLTPRLYGEEKNLKELISWSKDYFKSDDINTHSIFVSSGALDAIERTLRTNLRVGDKVAVEDPGYMTTLALIRSLGLRPVGLEMDEEGILPDSLNSAIDAGCRAVIFSNRAQNPTGICTSKARAKKLKVIASAAENVIFINDDHSGLLDLAPYFDWHTKTSKWVVIRSFSKYLGPDFRVAVSAGDNTTIGRLEMSQSLSMGWVSNFLQRVVHAMLTNKNILKQIKEAGFAYQERYQFISKELRSMGIATVGTSGLNLWLPVADEAALAQQLLASGWLVRTGSEFCVSSSAGLRVTTASLDEVNAPEFIDALQGTFISASTTYSA